MSAPATSATWAVRMSQVSKHFGSVQANRDVTLEVANGEIHALVGENGAGKSTLMHILSGLHTPSGGRVEVLGRDVTGWDTNEAIAAGVGMVHQHFMLVPTLTVAENLVLGREPRRGLQLDEARAVEDVRALAARTGLRVDPTRSVAELSVGEAQRVEILKVLYRGARILVLDEPTAVLSPPEVDELWTVLRGLRAQGDTIIIITHKLDEVVAISDTITVMRDGRSVSRLATADTTPREIARAMVGRDVTLATDLAARDVLARTGNDSAVRAASRGATKDAPPRANAAASTVASLEVRDLVVRGDRGTPVIEQLSFLVQPGEILGIAGVEGNGQTELLEVLAGLRRAHSGSVLLNGQEITSLDVRARADAGLSHIPEDRHRRGLVLDYSVSDNLLLGRQHHFTSRLGGLNKTKIERHAESQIRAFDIRPPDATLPARALSGGNQQKIVIAREMGRSFTVLLAAQPTRGVDVGAIEFIHSQLRAARDSGKGVLLVSADLSEVLALADRIAVMYEGRFACLLPSTACSAEILGPFMTGADREVVS
jgi:simple sugar transport system ATP-binding protein